MSEIKDRVWNLLFLDFYLDPRWTFRFKLMNLISGDTLRGCLTAVKNNLDTAQRYDSEPPLFVRRAKYWTDAMWKYYRK